ncbi:SusC/RagA family TonB-linked outer membrane protein [Mucilaginibacter ginkgonis]|uniref:TonB-dependent receptor n=1 Tax=Mucilaginibacter ginkgonis TaxID=2682091 RepID=A0A6I4HX34_9SPHI|nr:TonB-dependent receptor [Mucilaginibacter ginkgonis]QQL49826.1 TonB-dependent receptor [Mucilaginibacter ginkgonis]
MKKILLSIFAGILLLSQMAYAQTLTVTGLVTSKDDGQPLPGVTVRIKGTTRGTQTDVNGRYTIVVPSSESTLQFSFVGYDSYEQRADQRGNISLVSNKRSLSEVVVVGYGTQLRKDVTGSVSSIKGSDFTDRAIPSFDKDLAGKATGVQVIQPSGLLGQPTQIRIRGVNSINNGQGPLYVVDGVPVNVGNVGDLSQVTNSNSLADFNPNDIASFEVLKDGAATAIYGSRASNGVILITTKRGRIGAPQFTYDGYFAESKVAKRFNLLNADQFIEVANERLVAAGNAPQAFQTPNPNGGNYNTNWQDYLFRTGIQQNHVVSSSGGSEAGRYYFSLGYSNQNGIIIANSLKRYTFRASLDQRVNKLISVGLTAGATYQDNYGPTIGSNALSGNIFGGIRMLPNVPVYDPNDPTGFYISADRRSLGQGANLIPISDNIPNQLFVSTYNIRRGQTYRLNGNFFVQLDLYKGLKLKSLIGIDNNYLDDFQFNDPRSGDGFGSNGSIFQAYTSSPSYTVQNILTYNTSIAKAHNIDFTAVQELQKSKRQVYTASGTGISDIFFNQGLISNTVTTQNSGGSLVYRSIESYVGRLNYNYKNRYYIGGSIRADKLSNLPIANRTGYFPGVSAAYRVSEEPFFKESALSKVVSDFRLRGSFAVVGNTDIGTFPYLGLYSSSLYGNQNGIGFSQSGNADLRWEKQNKTDVGFDLGLFNNRISVTAAYYKQDSKDLILQAPTPASLGIPGNFIYQNVGAVRNTGFEFQVNADVIRSKDFTWNTTLNFTTQKNVVLSLVNGQTQIINSNNMNIIRVGESINSLYGYQYAGVNAANGNPLYVKANGQIIQGNVTTSTYATYDPANPTSVATAATLSSDDRVLLGKTLPSYFGGFNNTFTYKGFDLNVFLRWSGGNKVYNRTRVDLLNQNFVNNGTEILGRWQSAANPGDGVTPRQWFGKATFINQDAAAYSRFVENGDFLRMDNLAIGYKLPAEIVNKLKVARVRLYASAQNVFVITKYKGLDPEINNNGAGIDYNSNPLARTFTFGVNVGF